MKIRVIAMLLATSMITASLSGCGAKKGAQANSGKPEQVEVVGEDTIATDTASTDDSIEEAESQEEGGEEITTTLGGKPWINSMIKENLTEGVII